MIHIASALLPFALLALSATPLSATEFEPLRSVAEESGFVRTGRYAEVVDLCGRFAQRYPDAVRCENFGTSPEGRPMKLLVASRSGALTAQQAREMGVPVVLFQGGIHAGEIDGKDAGFLALRQMLDGEAAKGALDTLVLLFVPVFNVDGHERFKAWNRPNQRGPEEMGWRTTAQNLNLNRDYVKADAPEMRHLLELFNDWDPIAYADLHATDGAQFEHDISVMVEPIHSGDAPMREAGRSLRDSVIASLRDQGSLPVPFYPSFVAYDDPSSGFADGASSPRFSLGYAALRNRFGMLVETHSWKDYPTRVRITRNTIVALTELTATEGKQWRELADAADRRSQQLAGASVPVVYAATDKSRIIEFRGYAYTRSPSEISGTLMTRYDESTPQIWQIPLRDDVQASQQAQLPGFGYVIPAAHAAWMSAKLALHGVSFETLQADYADAEVLAFRASKVETAAQSFEGRQRLSVEGQWSAQSSNLRQGSLLVPVAGNNGYLLAALLDPSAPDSFLAWGMFNNHFESKEYMEPYVAEAVAREMLANDPAVAAEFNGRLGSDPTFAADPQARLDFFYRRHSSWDASRDLYPVLQLAEPLAGR